MVILQNIILSWSFLGTVFASFVTAVSQTFPVHVLLMLLQAALKCKCANFPSIWSYECYLYCIV